MPRSRVGVLVIIMLLLSVHLFATASTEKPGVIELEVMGQQPEYQSNDEALWDLYMADHPGVNVTVREINEGQEEALAARVAAGNPPHLASRISPHPNPSNYTTFVNLLEVDAVNLDNVAVDLNALYEQALGVTGYVPALPFFGGVFWSFIYYEDVLEDAGLDASTIRTWDDLDQFLAELKVYVDADPDISIVFDLGWDAWVTGNNLFDTWAISLGAEYSDLEDLFFGRINWTDLENNPYVPVFEKLKEYYELGYLPEWWARNWETDYEAGMIAGNSVFGWHGPWLWGKILAERPDANLGGVALPVGPGNKVAGFPVVSSGMAMWKAHQDTDIFPAVLEAFNWLTSTKIVEMQSLYVGRAPLVKNLSPDYVLDHPQFINVVRPTLEYANISYDPFGWSAVAKFAVEGRPQPLTDDAVAPWIGRYMKSEISLEELMSYLQDRWEVAYSF